MNEQTTSQDTPSLKEQFTPKTLTELGVMGVALMASISYLDTEFPKMGMDAVLTKLPVFKTLTPFKSENQKMDVDLSCVALDKQGNIIENIWYGNLRNDNESLRHGGDGLFGARNFEESLVNQEEIHVRIHELPENIEHLLFFISSYQQYQLHHAKKGVGEIMDNENNIIHRFHFNHLSHKDAVIVAWHLQRQENDFLVDVPLKPYRIEKTDPDNFIQSLQQIAKTHIIS